MQSEQEMIILWIWAANKSHMHEAAAGWDHDGGLW